MGISLCGNRTFIVLGMVLYVAFLVATVPAAMLGAIAGHFGGVRFAHTQGTLWAGQATIGVLGKPGGEISWKVATPDILLGQLHVRVSEKGEPGPMDIMLSRSGVELQHVSLTLPAALLSMLGKQMDAIQPGGLLHVKTDYFIFAKSSEGDMEVIWTNATSPLSHVNPLGSYRIHAKGAGPRVDLSLETLQGELVLNGSGTWTAGGRAHFSGTGASKNEDIIELLRIAGPPVGNGVYALKIH